MKTKTDIVREAVERKDWKKALQICKSFKIGITKEQKNVMRRAYECIVHPRFYIELGVDTEEAIRKGSEVVKVLYSV